MTPVDKLLSGWRRALVSLALVVACWGVVTLAWWVMP